MHGPSAGVGLIGVAGSMLCRSSGIDLDAEDRRASPVGLKLVRPVAG